MSQPPVSEVEQLRRAAHDLREVFAERGYRIEQATEVDPSFGMLSSRSALARELAVSALEAAFSRNGLDFRPVTGGGREVRSFSGGVDRRYRFRKATRRSDGSYSIPANSASALGSDEQEETLLQQETWVLGYTLDGTPLVQDVFVAPVVDVTAGDPGHLVLGRVIELLDGEAPLGGFRPVDEPLGIEDDEELGGESGS